MNLGYEYKQGYDFGGAPLGVLYTNPAYGTSLHPAWELGELQFRFCSRGGGGGWAGLVRDVQRGLGESVLRSGRCRPGASQWRSPLSTRRREESSGGL